MGHLAAKDIYRSLGHAIDGLTMRAPWSGTLRAILRELYTEEEADLVSRMPTGLATLQRVAEVTGCSGQRLAGLLGSLAAERRLPLPVLRLLLQRARKHPSLRPAQPPRHFALHRGAGRRALLGAFLALPPVKRLMMSDGFRSRFLARLAG